MVGVDCCGDMCWKVVGDWFCVNDGEIVYLVDDVVFGFDVNCVFLN